MYTHTCYIIPVRSTENDSLSNVYKIEEKVQEKVFRSPPNRALFSDFSLPIKYPCRRCGVQEEIK